MRTPNQNSPTITWALMIAIGSILIVTNGTAYTFFTGDRLWGAWAIMISWGIFIIAVAILLWKTTKNIFRKSTSNISETVLRTLSSHPKVEAVIQIDCLRLASGELLVAAKIATPTLDRVKGLAVVLGEIEAELHRAVPKAKHIYLVPDIYLPRTGSPPTDAIIIKSAD